MLDSRIAQTGVMVGVMGLMFGMVLAPIPNVASEYVLGSVLGSMNAHYGRHQAAFEAYQITASSTHPNYLLHDYSVSTAVDNPAQCQNSRGDFFQFENNVLEDNNCVGKIVLIPSISFYTRGEGPNSMYLKPSQQTLEGLPFYETD